MSETKQECRFCRHWNADSSLCLRLTDGGMAWAKNGGQPIYTNMKFGCNLFEARKYPSQKSDAQFDWVKVVDGDAQEHEDKRYELTDTALAGLLVSRHPDAEVSPGLVATAAVAVADAVLAELAKVKP